ncbi:hypothetical protein BU26DRAFT_55462 [Trematosphaeria pertusa]|uniref:Uncharacterized protein n=1 Tax=Trematosphaeria pertusa TaxID=390896 RepID=A0A6A6I8M3_9PLEO|nr:uncharacterized protein BU26DRAFT_55462 [Trematosphaeria pertusa]KAF2246915.1 hypothetical protein BU26DRAFT_55462 [Trematosphaeria pertusa]
MHNPSFLQQPSRAKNSLTRISATSLHAIPYTCASATARSLAASTSCICTALAHPDKRDGPVWTARFCSMEILGSQSMCLGGQVPSRIYGSVVRRRCYVLRCAKLPVAGRDSSAYRYVRWRRRPRSWVPLRYFTLACFCRGALYGVVGLTRSSSFCYLSTLSCDVVGWLAELNCARCPGACNCNRRARASGLVR